MEDIIQKIKDRIDIVELIGSYLKLQRAGANFRAICPFHSEKKPSFFVSPSKQIWHCFGCSLGGDIFKFVMQIEGVEFGDALRILAKRAGVELKTLRPELKTKRQRLYEISELACRFFEKQLETGKFGKLAKEYLLKRGLKEESIKKWRIGWAPASWRGLSDFLVGKGYKRKEIVEAGLAIEKEDSLAYDRFLARIIFPIFDLNSQVIGFGGRVFEKHPFYKEKKEIAKYLNTPNTLLYDKGKLLYGLNFAKTEIRTKNSCLLVEGYIDVILSHQAGFENAVACSGTSLTPFQLKLIKRYTKNLYLAYDMDTAGNLAVQRTADLAQSQDLNVKVIIMPKEKDPADIILENPYQWEKLVKNGKDLMEFYFLLAKEKFSPKTVQGKRETAQFLLPKIKQIPNKILQAHWIQRLSQFLKVPEEFIIEELKRIKIENEFSWPQERPSEKENLFLEEKTRKQILEEHLLAIILKNPQILKEVKESFLDYLSPKIKVVLATFKNGFLKGKFEKALKNLKRDDNFKEILDLAELKGEIQEFDFKKEFFLIKKEIEKTYLKEKLREISEKIKEAEERRNNKDLEKLLKEFDNLSKNFNKITNLS